MLVLSYLVALRSLVSLSRETPHWHFYIQAHQRAQWSFVDLFVFFKYIALAQMPRIRRHCSLAVTVNDKICFRLPGFIQLVYSEQAWEGKRIGSHLPSITINTPIRWPYRSRCTQRPAEFLLPRSRNSPQTTELHRLPSRSHTN
jgi:hypothetical protein